MGALPVPGRGGGQPALPGCHAARMREFPMSQRNITEGSWVRVIGLAPDQESCLHNKETPAGTQPQRALPAGAEAEGAGERSPRVGGSKPRRLR